MHQMAIHFVDEPSKRPNGRNHAHADDVVAVTRTGLTHTKRKRVFSKQNEAKKKMITAKKSKFVRIFGCWMPESIFSRTHHIGQAINDHGGMHGSIFDVAVSGCARLLVVPCRPGSTL